MSSTPSTFFLLSIIITLLCFPGITRSDDPCPYPCYPPPIGTTTPTTPTPSVTTSPPAPPQSGLSYPPPSGYVNPYNPTPPYGGGGYGDGSGSGGFGAPPPPDPILPYFPFYFRKPPHKPEGTSASSTTMKEWTGMVATTSTLLSLVLLYFV